MIDQFEKTRSNRSSCHQCLTTIKRGEIRGVEYVSDNSGFSQKYFCLECGERMLRELFEQLLELAKKR